MNKYWAELWGTFALVFLITTTIVGVSAASTGDLTLIAVPLVAGFALAAIVYVFGRVSGAHVNPAVTFGLWASGRLKAKEVLPYWFSQIVGGLLASIVLMALAGTSTLGATEPGLYGWGGAFLAEVVGSAILVTMVLGATAKKAMPESSGLIIGLTLAALHFAIMPFSGASFNPARSIGPALLGGGAALSVLWIYLVAPLFGAILAAYAHRTFLRD